MEKKELFVNETEKGTIYATYGGHVVEYIRHGNDIFGNPLYKIFPISFSFVKLSTVYKNYESKGYYLEQSYNIEADLIRILEEAEKIKPLPENWERSFEYYSKQGYRKVVFYM